MIALGLAVTGAVVIVGGAGQLVDYGLDLHIAPLDSSGDGGVLGVASVVALVAAAVAAWVVLAQARPVSLATAALPVLLTFLVLDNAVPAAGLTFVALALVAQRLPKQGRALLYAAFALLTTAFLLHLRGDTVLDLVGASHDGWVYQLKSVVKHGAEAGGWMLVAIALAASCGHVRLRSAR